MESASSSPIKTALAFRVGKGAGSAAVAKAVLSMQGEIDTALYPIIGQRGVAALRVRSVHLAGKTHPWLVQARDGTLADVDRQALESILAQQPAAEAASGGAALLQTFCDLLVSLIGSSLTERLLHHVWADPPGGPHSQDTSP